jgi:glycosyltransferase involved in cell wall biosynthesis
MGKKLFFISYYFPPIGGPGTMRPYYFVSNLQDTFDSIKVFAASEDAMYGLDNSYPVIQNPKVKFFRFDNSGLDGFKRAMGKIKLLPFFNFFFFPWFWERQLPWSRKLYKQLREQAKESRPDMVYVTSGPFSQVISAYKICRAFNIPFVVDLRDPFSESPGRTWMSYWHQRYFKKKEKKILNACVKVIVATPGMKRDYIAAQNIPADKIEVILNGIHVFDPAKVKKTTEILPGKTTELVYTGSLIDWDGHFNPVTKKTAIPFKFHTYNSNTRSLYFYMHAIAALKRAGKEPKAVFSIYGGSDLPKTKTFIASNKLEEDIVFKGKVPFTQLNAVYEKCDILVLLMEERVDGKGKSCFMTGKIYEYISSGKPIICIGSPNDATDLLDELSYPYIRWDNNAEKIMQGLEELAENGLRHEMNMEAFNSSITKCLRSAQAQQLANILQKNV